MSSSTTDRNQANVLVVDDDPRNRRLLEGYISSEGYQVRSACDGPEARAMAHQEVPDIVLLDVMMPGMTGHEVCRDLKKRPDTLLTQVVLVTALEGAAEGAPTPFEPLVMPLGMQRNKPGRGTVHKL